MKLIPPKPKPPLALARIDRRYTEASRPGLGFPRPCGDSAPKQQQHTDFHKNIDMLKVLFGK